MCACTSMCILYKVDFPQKDCFSKLHHDSEMLEKGGSCTRQNLPPDRLMQLKNYSQKVGV